MKRLALVAFIFLGGMALFYFAPWESPASENAPLPMQKFSNNENIPELAPKENVSWRAFVKPSESALRAQLTSLQFVVTQEEGTETPFQNEYWDTKDEGIYVDIVSGEPLFSSLDKYDSRTGWPSFTKPLAPENIVEKTDYKLVIPRTEIRSKRADSHLGHLFDDGPPPAGVRYCMNSASLRFVPKENLAAEGYDEFASLFQ